MAPKSDHNLTKRVIKEQHIPHIPAYTMFEHFSRINGGISCFYQCIINKDPINQKLHTFPPTHWMKKQSCSKLNLSQNHSCLSSYFCFPTCFLLPDSQTLILCPTLTCSCLILIRYVTCSCSWKLTATWISSGISFQQDFVLATCSRIVICYGSRSCLQICSWICSWICSG